MAWKPLGLLLCGFQFGLGVGEFCGGFKLRGAKSKDFVHLRLLESHLRIGENLLRRLAFVGQLEDKRDLLFVGWRSSGGGWGCLAHALSIIRMFA